MLMFVFVGRHKYDVLPDMRYALGYPSICGEKMKIDTAFAEKRQFATQEKGGCMKILLFFFCSTRARTA